MSLLQYQRLFVAQPTSAITWDDEKRALQTVIAAHECKEVSSQLATPINASTIKTSTISADLILVLYVLNVGIKFTTTSGEILRYHFALSFATPLKSAQATALTARKHVHKQQSSGSTRPLKRLVLSKPVGYTNDRQRGLIRSQDCRRCGFRNAKSL